MRLRTEWEIYNQSLQFYSCAQEVERDKSRRIVVVSGIAQNFLLKGLGFGWL